MPPRRRAREAEVPAEGGEVVVAEGAAAPAEAARGPRQEQRWTHIAFLINMPDGIDEPIPFTMGTSVPDRFRPPTEIHPQGYWECVNDIVSHYCWQWERGRERGRLHIQGCAALNGRRYLTTIKRLFASLPDGITASIRGAFCDHSPYATYEELVEYCSKSEDQVRWPGHGGRIPSMPTPVTWAANGRNPVEVAGETGQGHRSDLSDLRDEVVQRNRPYHELIVDPHYGPVTAKSLQWTKEMCAEVQRKRSLHNTAPIKVIVYWGTSGSAKTRRVWHESNLKHGSVEQLYPSALSSMFWNGYVGQKDILLDEITPGVLRKAGLCVSTFLRLLDRRQFRMEIKNSVTYRECETIYCTSNHNPVDWFEGIDSENLIGLLRRISVNEEFTPTGIIVHPPPLILQNRFQYVPEGGWPQGF